MNYRHHTANAVAPLRGEIGEQQRRQGNPCHPALPGESAHEPRFVQTVPKHGYRFIGDVKFVGRAGANTRPGPQHAIRAFQRALELNPDADETHHQLSMVLAHVGLLDEAMAHVRAAVRLNPNNTMARFRIGVYAAWQCRFGDAMETFKTIPRDASPMLIDRSRAEVLVQLGRRAEARAVVEAYLASHPVDEGGGFRSIAALLLALEGKASEADAAISRAVAIGQGFGHFHHTAYNIASALAVLGRVDDACG